MTEFGEHTELFRRAREAAEREELVRRIRDEAGRGLYVRRAFVRHAFLLRPNAVESVASDEAARFEQEKRQVRQILGGYAHSMDRGVGWDPAQWRLDLGKALPQTRHYALTLAELLVRSQDDVLREVFGDEPLNGKIDVPAAPPAPAGPAADQVHAAGH